MTRSVQARVNLRINADLADELRRLAKESERTLSAEIRYALREYIEEQQAEQNGGR